MIERIVVLEEGTFIYVFGSDIPILMRKGAELTFQVQQTRESCAVVFVYKNG